MIQHAYFEELCALAVSGQIAPDQLKSLKEHTATCAECLGTFADFGHIAGQLFEFAGKRMPLDPPAGITARFIARAHSEGIPLTRKAHDSLIRPSFMRAAALLAACLVLPCVLVLTFLMVRRGLATAGGMRLAPVTPAPIREDLLRENSALTQQVDVLHNQISQLRAKLKLEVRDLETAHSENIHASSRLRDLEKANSSVLLELGTRDTQIADLNVDVVRTKAKLGQLASDKAIDETSLQAAQTELSDLRTKVASLSEEMNENQQLSAAAEEAKDLIVARKLHIVDVDDTDGSGRRQRPFGRIFYAEGRKLVFYAYDLSDPRKLNTKIDFYVWGGREGVSNPVRSLGVFHPDDAKDGRWVLKFDDPTVLAEINCVFVTAESTKKPLSRPTGQQILFASLGPKPNHP